MHCFLLQGIVVGSMTGNCRFYDVPGMLLIFLCYFVQANRIYSGILISYRVQMPNYSLFMQLLRVMCHVVVIYVSHKILLSFSLFFFYF